MAVSEPFLAIPTTPRFKTAARFRSPTFFSPNAMWVNAVQRLASRSVVGVQRPCFRSNEGDIRSFRFLPPRRIPPANEPSLIELACRKIVTGEQRSSNRPPNTRLGAGDRSPPMER